jgi:pimeloyl-ACP methyl ester carboxylesterase
MRALGQEHGYIVVQPSANPAPPGSSWTPSTDDPKVFDFMQRVAAAWDVDPNRWHFTGFSQGGFMSWRFICDHADVLASVAPAAACGNGVAFPDCSFEGDEVPSEPLDILFMHGTDDGLVSYTCAEPRVAAVVEHFGLGDAETVDEGEGFLWTRHTGDDAVLEFVSHDYAAANILIRGHCYPGSTDAGDAPGQLFSFACEGDNGFVWGEIAMQFFIDHPKG